MRLVVDTNCIIAALVKDSISRRIILHFDGELITIAFSKEELRDHLDEILKKAKISESELDMILEKLISKIVIIDDRIIESHMEEAKELMEKTDPSDVPFIATALATSSPIWSDDKHFKKQDKILVITTKELIEVLKGKQD